MDALLISDSGINEIDIKRALLFFEHVKIISPEENIALIPDFVAAVKQPNATIELAKYGVLYDGLTIEHTETELLDRYSDFLGKEIKVVDIKAKGFYREHWMPLRLSYDVNFTDPEIINSCTPFLKHKSDNNSAAGIIEGGTMSIGHQQWYPDIPDRGGWDTEWFTQEECERYHFKQQIHSIIGRTIKGLAVSQFEQCHPVFTSPKFKDLCDIHIQRAYSAIPTKQQTGIELSPINSAIFEISNRIISENDLNNLSIQAIIDYRKANRFELERLERKLRQKYGEIANCKTHDDVDRFVNNNIQPLIDSVLRFSSSEKALRVAENIFTAAIPIATATVLNNLVPLQLAMASAFTTFIGTTLFDLKRYMQKATSDRTKFLTYYLNLRENH